MRYIFRSFRISFPRAMKNPGIPLKGGWGGTDFLFIVLDAVVAVADAALAEADFAV